MAGAFVVAVAFLTFEGGNLGPSVVFLGLIAAVQALPLVLIAALSITMSRIGGWVTLGVGLAALAYGDWAAHSDLDTDPIAATGFLLVPFVILGGVLLMFGVDALGRSIVGRRWRKA